MSLYERSLLLDLVLEGNSDVQADNKVLQSEIARHFDAVIKSKISKKGISIARNINAAFDTEYKHIEGTNENKLLSVQLAMNLQLVIKVPVIPEFELSRSNAVTGEIYKEKLFLGDPSQKDPANIILVKKMEKCINIMLKSIREQKYTKYDRLINLLVKRLESYKTGEADAVIESSLMRKDVYYFYLPRGLGKNYIYDNVGGSGFTLSDIIKVGRLRCDGILD